MTNRNINLVSIILLNYNGKIYLQDCLESVLNQSYTNFEIIFVDNYSTDGSFEYVKNNYRGDKLVLKQTEKNLGFAGGNNFALQFCKGEFIVLLNNDTVVDVNWLKLLVETITNNDNVGMAQSLVLTEGIPEIYYKKNGTINLLGHNIMEIFDINESGIGEIFQATGCSLIIKKEIVDTLGTLFPDEYFAYAEDTYLSFCVKFLGYRILHNTNSIVHHKGNASFKKHNSKELYFYQERNRLLNLRLFFPKSLGFNYYFYLYYNFCMKFILSLFVKRYSVSSLIKAYRWIRKNKVWIKEKRNALSKDFTKSENDVLMFLTSKLVNDSNLFTKLVNVSSLLYCKLTGIHILENKRI